MSEGITTFIGLDVHKESIAIAVACVGREAPRFVGTIGPSLKELLKALSHLGAAPHMLIVYEAGPAGTCGCGSFERTDLTAKWWRRPRSRAVRGSASRRIGAMHCRWPILREPET